MSVRFTNPAQGEYRTWFVCARCGFETRAINTSRPSHYREDRRDYGLELRDKKMLSKRKMPRPGAAQEHVDE